MRSIPVATVMREKLLRLSERWFVRNKSKPGLLREDTLTLSIILTKEDLLDLTSSLNWIYSFRFSCLDTQSSVLS